MQTNRSRFILLILGLSIFQLGINNSTTLYLDCLSVILVLLLFTKTFSFRLIITLSLFADLIGHWHLGCHLFAILLVSFLTQPILSFYRMSGLAQRCFMLCIFYSILTAIITLIGFITHNLFLNWLDFAIEVFILCPIIFVLYTNIGIRKTSTDIMY